MCLRGSLGVGGDRYIFMVAKGGTSIFCSGVGSMRYGRENVFWGSRLEGLYGFSNTCVWWQFLKWADRFHVLVWQGWVT